MANNQLVLPRKDEDGNYYISYSQLSKWKRSKRDYMRKYFFGEPDDNPALQKYGDFGHKVGEAYENDDFSQWSEKETEYLKSLPYYDEFEREIKLQMDGFYVLGYIDSNTKAAPHELSYKYGKPYVHKILDYKTGEVAKRQAEYESNDYKQVAIYSAALQQEYGHLPDEAIVVLIGRDGNAFKGEELTLAMNHAIIPKEINQDVIDETLEYVQQTAEEISKYYQAYLKLGGLVHESK